MINVKERSFLIVTILLSCISIMQELTISAIGSEKFGTVTFNVADRNARAGSPERIGDLITFGRPEDARRLIDTKTPEDFALIANDPDNLSPLLYRAVRRFNAAIPQEMQIWSDLIKYMVAKGADASLVPTGRENILHYLLAGQKREKPSEDWIQYLISEGVLNRHPDEIIEDLKDFLIVHGANPEHTNLFGKTPSFYVE